MDIFNIHNSLFLLDLYALIRLINLLKPVRDCMYSNIFVAPKQLVDFKAFRTSMNFTSLVVGEENFLSLSHLINKFPCLIFLSNKFLNKLRNCRFIWLL